VSWGVSQTRTLKRENAKEVSSCVCTSHKNTIMYGIVKQQGGKLVPDSQFMFFIPYHHLKVSKLDNSVVDLLRFNGKIRYQTQGGWWRSKEAGVVKDDGASENYAGQKFIEEPKCQWAAIQAKEAGWMIVDTANIKAEDGIEKSQRVKLKLRLGASYVYQAESTIYHIQGFDIVLGKRSMRDINR